MRSANLLPREEKELLEKERLLLAVRRFIIFSALSYAIVFGMLFTAGLYDRLLLESVDSQIQQEDTGEAKKANAELKTKIDRYNSIFNDYNTIAANNPEWSNVLLEFAGLVPADIVIQSFNANTASGKIEVSGFARNRDSVLKLRDDLQNSDYFKNTDFPLENLTKPGNLSFRYTFFLEENVLKEPPK
jgi:Tfp pilus assembly protein PilN